MIEPMFRVEVPPIEQYRKKYGGSETNFPITGRVLEMYRGTHIGQFWPGLDGLPHIAVYIKNGSIDRVVDEGRLDPAVDEIWKEYFNSLTCWEQWKRGPKTSTRIGVNRVQSTRSFMLCRLVNSFRARLCWSSSSKWRWSI